MTEPQFFDLLLVAWATVGLGVFILLFFVSAPYGRLSRRGWGPVLSETPGWLLMELPSALVMAVLFALGEWSTGLVPLVFLLLWEAHYFNRAFVYPFTLRQDRKMPLGPVERCMRIGAVHPFAMQRVEGVQVEDGGNPGAAVGQPIHLRLRRLGQGVAVQENEIAAFQPYQGRLRA